MAQRQNRGSFCVPAIGDGQEAGSRSGGPDEEQWSLHEKADSVALVCFEREGRVREMKNYVITIARGFGSGGKEIGVKLGKELGIPCYEQQILRLASESSGINEALFNLADERVDGFERLKGLPFNYVVEPSDKRFTSNNNLFNIQSAIIRRLAEEKSFIVIGKCADYVLKDFDNVASFYIEAPRADCVESIVRKMGVTEEEAHRLITKTDKYRADYYKYYTKGNYWTNPVNYDMTLNSARVGRDYCVEVIASYVRGKFDLA